MNRCRMLDRPARMLIDPILDHLGRRLARAGIAADTVTLVGLGLALATGAAIVAGWFWLALALLLASRLADGLDGAVARAGQPRDLGGLLDIVADFVFYAVIPLAFVLRDPASNGVAGAVLLAAFYVNAATFLGYAILAAKRGLTGSPNGPKAWYHSVGLLEGTETIGFFVLLCLWPAGFVPMAWGFAVLCLLTAALRIALAYTVFGRPGETG